MDVAEVREAIAGLADDAEVFAASYGFRSSELLETERCEVLTDPRETDDWGNEVQRAPALYIVLGDVSGNRYPPGALTGEADDV